MKQYVAVILVNNDGSLLAQHRDDIETILGPNTWCCVGGRRDPNDKSLKAAAARELREETEYELSEEDIRFLTRDTYVTEHGDPRERIIFWAWYDGKQEIKCLEGQEIRFIYPTEFSGLNFYTGHERFFRLAVEKVFGGSIERRG